MKFEGAFQIVAWAKARWGGLNSIEKKDNRALAQLVCFNSDIRAIGFGMQPNLTGQDLATRKHLTLFPQLLVA